MEIRWKPSDAVNSIWRNAALLLVGVVLAGVPAYATLALNLRSQMSKADVDSEIDTRNMGLNQSLIDLKEQVRDLTKQVSDLSALERRR
jgi:hypothetical protein